MVHFLQLLVTSGSEIGSFLSLDCNVHNSMKLSLMDWPFYDIFEEFLDYLLFLTATLQRNCLTFLTEKSNEHRIHNECD